MSHVTNLVGYKLGYKYRKEFQSFSEITSCIIDPLLRKRVGLNLNILNNWSMIVGVDMADVTFPLKIIWPRSMAKTRDPGILVIACEGCVAVKLQHKTGEVVTAVNMLFGYFAISRIRIEQKIIRASHKSIVDNKGILDNEKKKILKEMTSEIGNDSLRRSLFRLGESILSHKNGI